MSLTPEETARLIREHIRETVESIEDSHFERRNPILPDDHDARLELLDHHEADLREALGTGKVGMVARLARNLLGNAGYQIDETTPEFRRLCASLLDASMELVQHERNLLLGRWKREAAPTTTPSSPEQLISAAAPTSSSFSHAAQDFLDERTAAGRISKNTRQGYEATFRDWEEVIGNTPLGEITRRDVVRFRDTLGRLPKGRRKSSIYSALDIPNLLEMDIPEQHKPSPRTIKEALGRIQSFMKWAAQGELVPSNVADGVEMIAESDSREPYTDQEIRALFHHRRYQEDAFSATYQFWLPLLGLFTGARLAELCQLFVDDIVLDHGVPHMLFRDDKARGQRLKNKNSKRIVSIHSCLLRIGFVEYVRRLEKQGHDRLFPDLRWGERSAGQNASKRFAEFLAEIGIKRGGLNFHSFRHTVNTKLFQLEASPAKIQQLLGHRKASLGESNTYLSQLPPEDLRETVELLEFPVPAPSLVNRWRYLLDKLEKSSTEPC